MISNPFVSLCMPTNGVIEWVFPVLESIYSQGISLSDFEVVITDNGNNAEFKKMIKQYLTNHPNLVYAETDALPFVNEIESYKRAKGQLIKFVNHRTRLIKGTLSKLIDLSKTYYAEKPIVYFSNGILEMDKIQHIYENFNEFVKNLSYWSSWSTGMTIWREDLNKLPDDMSRYNELFPHTNILFGERNRKKYIIDNSIIFDEMPQGKRPKGNYNVFYAFGIEYPWIICTLLRDGSITADTFKYVIGKNLEFLAELYYLYLIKKEYCSYDLKGFTNIFGVFYSRFVFLRTLVIILEKKCVRKIKRMLGC